LNLDSGKQSKGFFFFSTSSTTSSFFSFFGSYFGASFLTGFSFYTLTNGYTAAWQRVTLPQTLLNS
jgi:hypothetical protein